MDHIFPKSSVLGRGRSTRRDHEDTDPLIFSLPNLPPPARSASVTPQTEDVDPFADPANYTEIRSLYAHSISRASTLMLDADVVEARQHRSHHRSKLRSVDLEKYLKGPRDVHRHSKWPVFLRMHGSILPKMVVPLLFLTAWATTISCISKYVHDVGFNHVLLTVTGFLVGMSLTFRTTTAYERYNEGRKYWAQLLLTNRNLGRLIWLHTKERHLESEELGKQDVLDKLVALNVIHAFAVALKHRLRFEPSVQHPDLAPLIAHLPTLAKEAEQSTLLQRDMSFWKSTGQMLGMSFAESNPRKLVKRATENLGNTPLELLTYLAGYFENVDQNGTLGKNMSGAHVLMASLTEVLTGCERVVNTPIPIAYSISVSQITWAYVLSLPFQLYYSLGMVTIPGTIVAGYIILGIAQIGRELENPFGEDVNDLPLDTFCWEVAEDIHVLTSRAPPMDVDQWARSSGAKVMYPFGGEYKAWEARSMDDIRTALKARAISKDLKKERIKTFLLGEEEHP